MTLDFSGQRPPQLVVAEGNNIFEVTETHIRGQRPPQLVVGEAHNILVVTERYLWPESAIFTCGRRPQDFISHMSRQKLGLWSL